MRSKFRQPRRDSSKSSLSASKRLSEGEIVLLREHVARLNRQMPLLSVPKRRRLLGVVAALELAAASGRLPGQISPALRAELANSVSEHRARLGQQILLAKHFGAKIF